MNLFSSNIEILKRSAPAKMGRRFLAGVVDMLLVVFVAALIFAGIFAITRNTSGYKAATATVNSEIEYYEELTREARVVEYIEGVRVSTDAVVYQNVIRALYNSYTVKGNQYIKNFEKMYEKYNQDEINKILSKPDNVTYFYSDYIFSKNITDIVSIVGKTPEAIVVEIYKESFGVDYMPLFEEYNGLPILKEDAAYYIFHHLFDDTKDVDSDTGSNYYQAFANAYANMLNQAEERLLKSEPYYSEHYLIYKEAYCNQALYTNIGLIISLFISCFIVLLIPKYLFKNERTIGYKLLGLGVLTLDNEENRWYVPLIKTFIEFFGLTTTTIILYLFPPFNGVYDAMFLPISIDSGISLGLIILITAILGVITNTFGLFTHYRQNLINIIFKDKVVDIRFIDEGDRDDKNEGRPY